MAVKELSSPCELEQADRANIAATRKAYPVPEDEFDRKIERDSARVGSLEEQFEQITGMEETIALVAVDEETVVGCGLFIWDPEETKSYVQSDWVELRTLNVHPDYWGEGHGTKIIEEATNRFPEHLERLVLNTFEDNRVGRSFYESRGFELIGERDFEFGETAYPGVTYALDLPTDCL